MTMAIAIAKQRTQKIGSAPRKIKPNGIKMAVIIDATLTYLVKATMIAHQIKQAIPILQSRAITTPSVVETPLPPLNFRKTDQQ